MCLKSSIFTTCWKSSLGCCPIVASFMWRLSLDVVKTFSATQKAVAVMAGSKLYMSEPGTVSLLVYAELAKGSVRAPLLPVFGPSPYSVAKCSVMGSLDISRATPTFFLSKIRSVSPKPFPKNKHKTFGLHKPQWWHQRVIVTKWKDKHSKTIRIYYILFTHHNGTILEQLSGRVNERKGTKNKQIHSLVPAGKS